VQIDFPFPGYEDIGPINLPDQNLMGLFTPASFDDLDEQAVLRKGFAMGLGAPRLRDAVKRQDDVLILIDDATRATPTARILPHVLAELHAAGVEDRQISFLQAPGTHRAMNEQELRQKLGSFFGQYPVYEHQWLDEASLHEFGHTRDGTRVTANKRVAEADFVIGIGSIVPHRVKGLSGGAKIMFPGVSGREMMDRNQWEASMHMSETVMGTAENSMRLRMEEAARIAGLNYIVNIVYDTHHKAVGCYCGDFVAAHREGAKRSLEVYGVHLPARADIVVIDSFSQDRDFWQSAKGVYAGTMAVKEGGSLILVSPNPEGVASNHPIVTKLGYKPSSELVAMVQRGEVDDLVGVAILHDVSRIVEMADCIMASPGVNQQDAEKLGFRYARTPQDAVDMAMVKQGKHAQVAVIRNGGHVLPLVDNERTQLAGGHT
jgi:nickel-dependent lactate racemase